MSGTSKSLISILILIAIVVITVTTIIFIILFPVTIPEEPEPVVIVPEPVVIVPEPVVIVPEPVVPRPVIPQPMDDIVFPTVLFEEVTVCEPLNVQIEFSDYDGKVVDHVNYDVDAIQNDNILLSDTGAHRHPGKNPIHQTDVLLGVFPIDFIVTMQGIGHGEDIIEPIDKSYTLTVTPNSPGEINCELLHENVEEILPQ